MLPNASSPERQYGLGPLRVTVCNVYDTEALTSGELDGRRFVVFEHYDFRGQEPGDPGYGVNLRPDQWVWDVHRMFWDGKEGIYVADVLASENSHGLIGLAVQHCVEHSNQWVIAELEEAFAQMRRPGSRDQQELDYIKGLLA